MNANASMVTAWRFSLILVCSLWPRVLAGSSDMCGNMFEARCSILGGCKPNEILDYMAAEIEAYGQGESRSTEPLNQMILKNLNDRPLPNVSGERRASLSLGEVTYLHRRLTTGKITSNAAVEKYDPEGCIGFCFGRALSVHLEALWGMNLDAQSIRKIWAVGNLVGGDMKWSHHVATIVRGADGQWYAIDTAFPGPVTVEKWHTTWRDALDKDQTMILFDTAGNRWGPYYRGTYPPRELNNQFYNGFFVDLLKEFQQRRDAGDL